MDKMNRETLMEVFERLYSHYGPQGWWPGETPFEVIVGAILTQNTAWSNVEKAISNLKKDGPLTPEALFRMDETELAMRIRPSGYYNVKARRLKDFVRFLFENYGGKIEEMFNEDPRILRERLLRIRGIGPETADSILLYGGNIPVFVVDTYTYRVFNRHGLLPEEISYEECQKMFMENLPKDAGLFNEYHALIVRVAKEFCKKGKPLCRGCPLEGI